MAEYVAKYADGRGQIHQQVTTAASEKEVRDKYSNQGFLVYSVKPRSATSWLRAACWDGGRNSTSKSGSSSISSSSR